MNEKGTLRIGIIGTGFIVRKSHLPGLAAVPSCLVTGFFDLNKEAAENARIQYIKLLNKHRHPLALVAKGETRVYDDLETMIREVDAVDICTPPMVHLDNLALAVRMGKHVICEKPLARNYWAVHRRWEEIYPKNRVFQLHTQAIWNPAIAAGKKIIADGKIGKIKKIRILHQGADPKHTVNLPALWNAMHGGGGALMDIGPHAYSVMWYWLGPGWTPATVKAELLEPTIPVRTIAGKPNTRVEVEDDAHVTITWQRSSNESTGNDQPARDGEGPGTKGMSAEEKDGKGDLDIIIGELEATWNDKDWFDDDRGDGRGTRKGSRLVPTLYYEVRGTLGTLTFPHVTLSLANPTGIAVQYRIQRNDGRVEKINLPAPKPGIEDFYFFKEFSEAATGKISETRNNFAFASTMLQIFGAAYLSRKIGYKEVTLDEYDDYCRELVSKDDSSLASQSNATDRATVGEETNRIIKDLFSWLGQ